MMKSQGRLVFYHAALETGLCAILRVPMSLEEAALGARIRDRDLLSSLLDLGISLREVSYRKGKYRLKGAMAKALARDAPLAALVRETVLYHADVAKNIGAYLAGQGKGNYLDGLGGVIAESSRVMEPMIRAFIRVCVRKSKPLMILEFGCGAGEYLKYYVDINRANGGVAIDMDGSAVEIARKNVQKNGIGSNFTVMRENILQPVSIRDRRFDLVTSYSNMHYFSGETRKELFRRIHGLLTEKGRFMLATGFKSPSLSSSYYDCIFTATEGLYGLPRLDEVVRDLKEAGFGPVETVRLMGGSFTGIVAHA